MTSHWTFIIYIKWVNSNVSLSNRSSMQIFLIKQCLILTLRYVRIKHCLI